MGFIGNLRWDYKRSLVWRIKAGMKKAMKIGIKKQGFKFQYDPQSYALNFDDGGQREVRGPECNFVEFQGCPEKTIWVYVLWVE